MRKEVQQHASGKRRRRTCMSQFPIVMRSPSWTRAQTPRFPWLQAVACRQVMSRMGVALALLCCTVSPLLCGEGGGPATAFSVISCFFAFFLSFFRGCVVAIHTYSTCSMRRMPQSWGIGRSEQVTVSTRLGLSTPGALSLIGTRWERRRWPASMSRYSTSRSK
ncbi:hypothetical protein K431DRAFT_103234 [Polychaeton citri CBS 116435]|uniref:Uncharacterized protein n=1 Tax=Polychaeton citri CBS 116435 TaxID=1314669 RepID=A0A9P4Q3G8_9PEZI|nr:hypothetical protein K431DRAFT_103234 [Polychaeton citri CBS 116435]